MLAGAGWPAGAELMNGNVGRYLNVAAAVVLAAITGAARAEEPMTEVLVEVPQTARTGERQEPLRAPIDIASVKYRVSYADLDLSTASGAKEFEERVVEAAKRACRTLDASSSLPGTVPVANDPSCTQTATEAALKRARAAIAAAEARAKK